MQLAQNRAERLALGCTQRANIYNMHVMCLLLRRGFHLATLQYHKGLIGGEVQRLLSISTEELLSSVSDHRVLGHLPDQGPSSPIAQFGRPASSRKSLGGSKLLPFKNDGCHCVLGDLQWCRNILVLWFPIYMPRHNLVSELYGQFLCLRCQLWDLIYCRQGCVFPNHVQSI